MTTVPRRDLAHDLVLPTLLFAVLGGMTWAVRGCSGFGGMNGCVFAGVTWGTAWWFIARDPGEAQSRRYASGWIILALTLGIGFAGNRGWMQWPSFFEGHLQTNAAEGRFVPIPRIYGFLWLFLAGVPWAGLGACLLAWCGSQRPLTIAAWGRRIACGLGAALAARLLFDHFPQVFLPLYSSMQAQYADWHSNPNLRRLTNDNLAAMTHLGLYLGFLAYEAGRKDWKNVTLIVSVGLLNGLGWAICQNWKWAPHVWPQVNFNWWRCWESCGGISIGLAYGLAYFLVNRRLAPGEARPPDPRRSPERLAVYLALVLGLGLSLKNGLKGWANIYLGNEQHWNHVLWTVIGPLMILAALAISARVLLQSSSMGCTGGRFPRRYRLVWLVIVTQNAIAQLVTGPRTNWSEMVFSLYYGLLFPISAVIVYHFHTLQNARMGRLGHTGTGEAVPRPALAS